MPCKVKDIAQYIVNYFIQRDNPVAQLKLQGLLYFSWIEYFEKVGEYLFSEPFKAWVLGPIVPEVYTEYCAYGADNIYRFKDVKLSGVKTKILDSTLEKYAGISGYELLKKSCSAGGAWGETYKDGKGRWSRIDFDTVKKFKG